MSNHEAYKKYANLDFELPITQPDMEEMVDKLAKQLRIETNKQLEEQFIVVLKQALVSGDFVNVIMGNASKLIYVPFGGIQALRIKHELALEILEKHGLLEEFQNAERGEDHV
jgi:hypothetical protein